MNRLSLALALVCAASAQDFDLMIRGGKLVDGTGNPWRMADVGIKSGRIVQIGDLKEQSASKTIDANGLVVAPGFIDIHNHSDDTIVADGNAESMVRQGVTSMIFGEGGSAAPLGGKQGRGAERADWTDFDGYFSRITKQGISTNVGTYVGSSQVWTYVRGHQPGPPTSAELNQMEDLVRQAMRQGALGVASSLSGPPGSWIDTETLVAMCKVAAEYGGIYSTHMRTEGQGVFESIAEALEIGRKAKIPVDIIHLKLADHKLWGRMPEVIATIRQARANGQQVEAHVYPYRAGQNNLSTIIPPWAHEGGTQAMLQRLKDPKLRDRLRNEIQNGIPGSNWYNHYTATGSWEGMLLVSLSNPEYKRFEGKRMNEVIAALGGDPLDVLFKLLDANSGSIPTIYFHHNEDDMRQALVQPFVSIGSDGTAVKTDGPLAKGNPHPRYYGTFPRVLGRYVRDEKVLTLEEAVRKMTSANAAKIGLYDRGIIRDGLWADITIFDPKTVIDNSTWDKPHQYSTGIEYVLVNGDLVLERGRHTNARPGKILYGAGHDPESADAKKASSVPPDREAADWVIRSGGSVRIAGKPETIRSLAALPEGDVRVIAVDLIGTTLNPSDLKRLSGLKELTELLLPGPSFNPGAGSRLDANDELRALAGLKKLEKLHFSLHFLTNINVQDKGLAHLKELTNLKELRGAQTRIKGPGLVPFQKLEKLDLNYTTFGDDGMSYLKNMKGLKYLSLRDTLVSDAGLTHLAALTDLVTLDLYGARITDQGIQHLSSLTKLQELNLLGATISDAGLDALKGMAELRELNVYRAQITNSGLDKLKSLKNLEALDLRYTRVTRGGVDDFRRGMPNCEVEFQDAAPQPAAAELRRSSPATANDKAIAEWVLKLGGKATLADGRVREIDLSRTPVTDAQLRHLKVLDSLQSLSLQTTEIGDAGAAAIAELAALRRLDLSHTMTSDAALVQFSKLPHLDTLLLGHSLVTAAGLDHITASKSLRRLSLAGCSIRDKGTEKLGEAGQLLDLDLSYTDVTDAGIAHLKKLVALERLDLTATEIGDGGLREIGSMTNLKHLLISYGQFTSKGPEQLAGLTNLVTLEVARTRVDDATATALASLQNLRRLNLDYTSVSDKGLAVLAKALPKLQYLRLDSANVTDAAVDSLVSLKSLRELNLYHTLVTDRGVEALKAALPECRIVYDRESALPNRRKS